MSSSDRNDELGLQAALTSRMRPIDSVPLMLRVAIATTLSYYLAHQFSASALPIFAPMTTLFVVQSSPFSTLGVTAQRVLGTGLGVAAATLYVTWVPVVWWSVFLAVFVALLVARSLPVGLAGQLQIPVAVVFVLALGPGDLSVDLWRVLDVALGAAVGVAAVFVLPPRPQLDDARRELTSYASELTTLLCEMADEAGSHAVPLHDDTRHAFVTTSRALRGRAGTARDAVARAVESARLNPRARAVGDQLDRLDGRLLWLTRIAIHTRSLAGAVDRVYDRPGLAPALPRTTLSSLLTELAALVDSVAGDGVDEDSHAISDRMTDDIRMAVELASGGGDIVGALGSLSLLGRIEQLRETAAAGPRPHDVVEGQRDDEDDEDDSSTSATERLRRLLGRE